jgi:hypothetical protein
MRQIGQFLVVPALVGGMFCLGEGRAQAVNLNDIWYFSWHSVIQANFTSMKDGRCLDATNASASNGTVLGMFDCNHQWNQRWMISPGARWLDHLLPFNGRFWLAPYADTEWWSISVGDHWGQCVDVPGSNDVLGQHLQLWSCNGTPAQSWRAGNVNHGENPFWIRSSLVDQGANRCWSNGDSHPHQLIARLSDCAD